MFDIFTSFDKIWTVPKWRNWQTQRTQNPPGLAPLGVRLPPSAPLISNIESRRRTQIYLRSWGVEDRSDARVLRAKRAKASAARGYPAHHRGFAIVSQANQLAWLVREFICRRLPPSAPFFYDKNKKGGKSPL